MLMWRRRSTCVGLLWRLRRPLCSRPSKRSLRIGRWGTRKCVLTRAGIISRRRWISINRVTGPGSVRRSGNPVILSWFSRKPTPCCIALWCAPVRVVVTRSTIRRLIPRSRLLMGRTRSTRARLSRDACWIWLPSVCHMCRGAWCRRIRILIRSVHPTVRIN